MSAKRISLVALSVFVFAAALFFKQQLLSASDRDLMHHFYGLQADQFHDPVPGKAYAFYLDAKKFDPSAICELDLALDDRTYKAVHLQGVNLAGESYNAALEGAGGYIGEKIIDVVRARNTQRVWALKARFHDGAGSAFSNECLQDIDTRIMLRPDLIYVVDTVYYRDGEDTPFLVVFKTRPVILECGEDCRAGASVKTLIPPDRITQIKGEWGILRFSRPEPDTQALASQARAGQEAGL